MKVMQPQVKSISREMTVLSKILQYENIFEDYIKFAKENRDKQSAFLIKKCNEVQLILNDYNPEEANNDYIRAFIGQYKQKSFELDCYKKVQNGMSDLERLKETLTRDKQLNSSLESQTDNIVKIINLINSLKSLLQLDNYKYFNSLVKQECMAQKMITSLLVNLTFKNVDQKL